MGRGGYPESGNPARIGIIAPRGHCFPMDEQAAASPRKDRIIDWRALGKRARKPSPWVTMAAVAVIVFLALEAYVWGRGDAPAPVPEERFRFDAVYLLERGSDGNF